MLFICRNRIRLFVCLQMLCRPPDTWVACTVTVPGLPHAQHISMDLPHATKRPLQECRLFGVPALGWPWGCSQKGQFRKLTHLEAGKEQLWQQSELLLVLRVLRDIFKSGTKCYNNLCHAFTFIWMYISFGTCIFFLSKIFAEFISKRLFNKNLSFFFFFFKPLLNTKNFSWIFRGWWKTAWERCLHSAYDMKSKPRKGILSRLSFCPVVTFKYSTAVMANPPLKWVILPGIVLSSQIAFHILIQKLSQTMFLPLEYAPSGQAVFANKPERKSLA